MVSPRKVIVRLSEEQRKTLTRIVRTGTHPAAMLRRAQVLLKADADGPDGWSDMRIGKALGCSFMTVRRVRQQFVVQGLDATLHRKRPTGRQYRKLDGEQEAQLIAAVACSPAPDGRARWTMKLLAERLVEAGGRRVDRPGDRLPHASKNALKPWLKQQWVIPPTQSAAFVANMEDVLDVYARPPARSTRRGRSSASTRAASS